LCSADRIAFERDEKGRYKSVTCIDNASDGTRTVTLVEDLTKGPLKRWERQDQMERENNEREDVRSPLEGLGSYISLPERDTTTTQAAPAASPGAQQRQIPPANVGSSSDVSTPQGRDEAATWEMDSGEAPPPYTHHLTAHL
jgi:hypothetical protein